MRTIPLSLQDLISEFSKLPGIGKKTAERLSIHILKTNTDNVNSFIHALHQIKENIKICEICHAFKDEVCEICNDSKRDQSVICIVKDPTEIFLIDKTNYNGLYHVLNGLISPLDGIEASHLNIDSLLKRLSEVEEIILGIESSSEGDITNLYLSKLFKEENVKVTRFARGIPVGSSLEFLDEGTINHSINDRVELEK